MTDPALAELSSRVAADPNDWDARHRLAFAQHQAGDTSSAVELMRAAIRIAPEKALLHNTMGVLHHASGRIGPAVAHYQEAIALDPAFQPPYDNVQRALNRGGTANELFSTYDPRLMDERSTGTKRVMVVSHERSGTHLLINTLALNFRHSALWVDVETSATADGRAPTITPFLDALPDAPFANVLKSHHSVEMFQGRLTRLSDSIHIFYVYRDGRDVMTSFWRFANDGGGIDEGPRRDSVGAFMSAPPSGRTLLFQTRPPADMLDRWINHVTHWLDESERPNGIVTAVRYEDLIEDFDNTLDVIAEALGAAAFHRAKPSLRLASVAPWRGWSGNWREFFDDHARALFTQRAGDLIKRLNYDDT